MTLPLRIERAVAETQAVRTRLTTDFELMVRTQLADARSSIMCTKGCASCCYHPVLINVLEGIPLLRHLVRLGLWAPALRKEVEAHAQKTFGLAPQVWLLSLMACPLLDSKTNLCRAHAHRPFMCRVTYSVGDPLLCHPHKLLQARGMVNPKPIATAFFKEEAKLFRTNGARLINIPISTALLLAERLDKGELDFEQLNQHMTKEFLAL